MKIRSKAAIAAVSALAMVGVSAPAQANRPTEYYVCTVESDGGEISGDWWGNSGVFCTSVYGTPKLKITTSIVRGRTLVGQKVVTIPATTTKRWSREVNYTRGLGCSGTYAVVTNIQVVDSRGQGKHYGGDDYEFSC